MENGTLEGKPVFKGGKVWAPAFANFKCFDSQLLWTLIPDRIVHQCFFRQLTGRLLEADSLIPTLQGSAT